MSNEFNRKLQNDAQENPISEPEKLETSVSRLSAPSDNMQHRLTIVDHLLMTAPLVLPSADFAERVIEAIRKHRSESFNRYTALGVILGLGTAVTVVVSLLVAVILIVANIIIHWTDVYQGLIIGAGKAMGSVEAFAAQINESLPTSPLMVILSLLSIPLFFVWVWVMRRLNASEVSA